MLNYTKEELLELGAEITTREIYQQPDVWKEAFEAYQAKREEIAAFLQGIAASMMGKKSSSLRW